LCSNIEELEKYIKEQEWVKPPEEDFNERILESLNFEQVLWFEYPDGSKFYLYDFKEHPFRCNLEEPDYWEHDEEEGELERARHLSITVDFGNLSLEECISKICALFSEAQVTQPIRVSTYYRKNIWTKLLEDYPSHEEKTIVKQCGPFDIEKISNIFYHLEYNKAWWSSRQLKDLKEFLQAIPEELDRLTINLRLLDFDFVLKPSYLLKDNEGMCTISKIELSSQDHVGKTQEFNEKLIPLLWEYPLSFKVCREIEYKYLDEPELNTFKTEVCAR